MHRLSITPNPAPRGTGYYGHNVFRERVQERATDLQILVKADCNQSILAGAAFDIAGDSVAVSAASKLTYLRQKLSAPKKDLRPILVVGLV